MQHDPPLSVIAVLGRRRDEWTGATERRAHPPLEQCFLPYLHKRFCLGDHLRVLYVDLPHTRAGAEQHGQFEVYQYDDADPEERTVLVDGHSVLLTRLARPMNFNKPTKLGNLLSQERVQGIVFDQNVAKFVSEPAGCFRACLSVLLAPPAFMLLPDAYAFAEPLPEAPVVPLNGPDTLIVEERGETKLSVDVRSLTSVQLYAAVAQSYDARASRAIKLVVQGARLARDSRVLAEHGVADGTRLFVIFAPGGIDPVDWSAMAWPEWHVDVQVGVQYPLEHARAPREAEGTVLFLRSAVPSPSSDAVRQVAEVLGKGKGKGKGGDVHAQELPEAAEDPRARHAGKGGGRGKGVRLPAAQVLPAPLAPGGAVVLNSAGYPLRPAPDCTFYCSRGRCDYGARCRYNHPEEVAAAPRLLR